MELTPSISLVSVNLPLSSYAQSNAFSSINNEIKEIENDVLNPNSLENETACSIWVKLAKEVLDIYGQRMNEIVEKLRGELTDKEFELLSDELKRFQNEFNSTIGFIELVSRLACGR